MTPYSAPNPFVNLPNIFSLRPAVSIAPKSPTPSITTPGSVIVSKKACTLFATGISKYPVRKLNTAKNRPTLNGIQVNASHSASRTRPSRRSLTALSAYPIVIWNSPNARQPKSIVRTSVRLPDEGSGRKG